MDIKLEWKVRNIVDQYKRLMPQEYAAFVAGIKEKMDLRANKFGEIKGTASEMRIIGDRPEMLDNMLMMQLGMDEWKIFLEKESQRWFSREFREFSAAEKI